jgi:hypothetical protein
MDFHLTDTCCGMDHVCRARDMCAPNMYVKYSENIDQIYNQYYNLQVTLHNIHGNYGYNSSGTYKYSIGTTVWGLTVFTSTDNLDFSIRKLQKATEETGKNN